MSRTKRTPSNRRSPVLQPPARPPTRSRPARTPCWRTPRRRRRPRPSPTTCRVQTHEPPRARPPRRRPLHRPPSPSTACDDATTSIPVGMQVPRRRHRPPPPRWLVTDHHPCQARPHRRAGPRQRTVHAVLPHQIHRTERAPHHQAEPAHSPRQPCHSASHRSPPRAPPPPRTPSTPPSTKQAPEPEVPGGRAGLWRPTLKRPSVMPRPSGLLDDFDQDRCQARLGPGVRRNARFWAAHLDLGCGSTSGLRTAGHR